MAQASTGVGAKLAGILLYLLAAIGGVLSITAFISGQAFRRRHADTGDFTGAAMLESFVIIFVLPLTVSALIGGLWLFPFRLRGRVETDVAGPSPPPDRTFPTLFALGLVGLAIGYLVFVARLFSPQPLPAGIAFWVVFSPSILMAIAMSLVAWRVIPRRR